jgi:hypothetical protein
MEIIAGSAVEARVPAAVQGSDHGSNSQDQKEVESEVETGTDPEGESVNIPRDDH